MKVCISCSISKEFACFSSDAARKDGLTSKCKECQSAYFKAYYAANKARIIRNTGAYQSSNRSVHRKAKAKWQASNKDRHLETRRKWHQRKYASDMKYRMNFIIRGCLRRTLAAAKRNGASLGSGSLPFTPDMLRQRIEMNFRSGMSWSNYGQWHIDHRVPVARLIRKGVTDPAKINCLANLAPLWAMENMTKGKR